MERTILSAIVLSVMLIAGCTQTTLLRLKSEDITTFSLSWNKSEDIDWISTCEKCQQNKTFCEQGFEYTLIMNFPEGIDEGNCKMIYKHMEYPPEEYQFFLLQEENIDRIGSFNLNLDENNEVVACCGLGNEYKQACRIAMLPIKCMT